MVCIDEKRVLIKYINVIKNMYNEIVGNMRNFASPTSEFPITIEPNFFVMARNEFTKATSNEIP